MAIFKLTKSFKGGQKVFYIELPGGEEPSEDMLESIGDKTDGGQVYGYRIDSEKVDVLPEGEKLLPRTFTEVLY